MPTIDSPSAMIKNTPKRSTRWPASKFIKVSLDRSTRGVARSTMAARAQIRVRHGTGRKPPTSISGPLTQAETSGVISVILRPRKYSAARMTRSAKYAPPNRAPRAPYACGRANAMNSAHSARARMPARSIGLSVSCRLAWTDVPTHAQ
jgi:hypothetical protein